MDKSAKQGFMPELKDKIKRWSSDDGDLKPVVPPGKPDRGKSHTLPRTSHGTGSHGTSVCVVLPETQKNVQSIDIKNRPVPQPPSHSKESQIEAGKPTVSTEKKTTWKVENTNVMIPEFGVYGSAKEIAEQGIYKSFNEVFQKGVVITPFKDDNQNLHLNQGTEVQFVEDRYSQDYVFLELHKVRYRVPRNLIVPPGDLRIHSWFHGDIERKEAEKLIIQECGNGGFLIRQRPTEPKTYALSMIGAQRQRPEVAHYIIEVVRQEKKEVFYIKPDRVFERLEDLVEYYKTDGTDLLTSLKDPAPKLFDQAVDDNEYTLPNDTQLNDDDKPQEVEQDTDFPKTSPPAPPARSTEEIPKQVDESKLVSTDKQNPLSKDKKVVITYKTKLKLDGGKEREVILQELGQHFSPNEDFRSFVKAFLQKCVVDRQDFVEFIGFCVGRNAIIHEYMARGTLKDELVRLKKDSKRLDYAKQISDAMSFLESKALVHGNMAAKNIFLHVVDGKKKVKIADMGFKILVEDTLTIPKAIKEQSDADRWRWAAPEVFSGGPITQKSDVWSYAMVLLEITSGGKDPWDEIKTVEAFKASSSAENPQKPTGCHTLLYQNIMVRCWNREPMQRPSFKTISEYIEALIA